LIWLGFIFLYLQKYELYVKWLFLAVGKKHSLRAFPPAVRAARKKPHLTPTQALRPGPTYFAPLALERGAPAEEIRRQDIDPIFEVDCPNAMNWAAGDFTARYGRTG
jgi:hypothetical protein